MWRSLALLGLVAVLCQGLIALRCGPTIDTCVVDGDCGGVQVCSSSSCVPPGCQSNGDCTVGEWCINRRCQPQGSCFGTSCPNKSQDCKQSLDCNIDEDCINNVCQKKAGRCAGSQDCQSNQDCINGSCKYQAGFCGSRLDCLVTQLCVNGRCQESQGPEPSLPDASAPDTSTDPCGGFCLPSEACVMGRCEKKTPGGACFSERDCTSVAPSCQQFGSDCLLNSGKSICLNGKCVPEGERLVPSARCTTDATGGRCG